MLDQEDEGTRIGVWVALGVVFFVLAGVIGGLILRHMNGKAAPTPKPAVVAAAPAAVSAAPATDALLEGPLAGDLVGTLYFDIGKSELPIDAAVKLDQVAKAMAGAPARTLVLSGFHDASGDPAQNAELAKQRALAARESLKALGVDASRLKLRKPESTTGDGTAQEARRVEMRLVD
jgi:outer membrane protein OmpA-like peptidoglycan-associated protein